MDLKKPLTYSEQVSKLIEHGMIVEDKGIAEDILSRLNYYRFTGYALQFRKNSEKSNYVPGTSFDKVYRIYQFDAAIRDICRKYIEIAEVYYRTQISYVFSLIKCIEAPYDQHYDETNFYNKAGYYEILESFKKEKNYYKDSLIVKHHKIKYANKMPLWVMVELMSFSNVSKLYGAMYNSDQEAIAKAVGTSKAVLENHLHCMSVLRNKCAHAARMYNIQYNPPAKLSPNLLRKHPEIANDSLFAYILVLLKRLPKESDKRDFVSDLDKIITVYDADIDLHLIGFPQDYSEILLNNI